jgi:hypothetical protein
MRSARTEKLIQQPQHWQDFPRGETLRDACQQVCNELATRMFGYHLVKLGPLSAEIDLPDCPIRHQVALNTHGSTAQARGLNTELPLQGNSVDAFFLSLELDFATDPHRVLREVDHGITTNGSILLCCLNPLSAAGITKMLPVFRKHPLKQARFFSAMRMKDWLNLLHYEVVEERYFFYQPIFTKRIVPLSPRVQSWTQQYLGPYLDWTGSVYCLLAKKQTIPMTKVKMKWSKAPRFVPVSAASSQVISPASPASRPHAARE